MTTGDAYVRRWRPTFGYVCAGAWGLQAVGVFVGIGAALAYPGHAAQIMGALGQMLEALTLQWGVALTVLGLNISAWSRDKAIAAGEAPAPSRLAQMLDGLVGPG